MTTSTSSSVFIEDQFALLLDAIKNNKIEKARELLQQKDSSAKMLLEQQDERTGMTALMHLCSSPSISLDFLRLLIETIKSCGDEGKNGKQLLQKQMIEIRNKNDGITFHHLAANGKAPIECVEYFLNVLKEIGDEQEQFLKRNFEHQDKQGVSAFIAACYFYESSEIIELFLNTMKSFSDSKQFIKKQFENERVGGFTPLFCSCDCPYLSAETTKLLLETIQEIDNHEGNGELLRSQLEKKDRNNHTPFLKCCSKPKFSVELADAFLKVIMNNNNNNNKFLGKDFAKKQLSTSLMTCASSNASVDVFKYLFNQIHTVGGKDFVKEELKIKDKQSEETALIEICSSRAISPELLTLFLESIKAVGESVFLKDQFKTIQNTNDGTKISPLKALCRNTGADVKNCLNIICESLVELKVFGEHWSDLLNDEKDRLVECGIEAAQKKAAEEMENDRKQKQPSFM